MVICEKDNQSFFLDLHIDGCNHEILLQVLKAYAIPIVLMLVNHIIYFRHNIVKYKRIWMLINLIPSVLLLLLFKMVTDNSNSELLSGYQFQLIALFPKLCTLIQLLLIYIWKVERRDDPDVENST